MNLDENQKKEVAAWIEQGLKLAEVQKLLETKFGLRPTYLEVRLLMNDLKLQPKDPTPPPAKVEPAVALSAVAPAAAALGKVSVSLDTVTAPGSMVSGKVTFSDGKSAAWFMDQTGRLTLAAAEKGYRPTPADVEAFQLELQRELQGLGF